MKPSGKRSLAATITSIFAACSLFSAFGAERVAFVIGNDAYPTVPLENAVRDATAFRDMLTRDLGFAAEDVVFMTNSGRLAIFEQFESFKKKTAGAKIVLVFYAGHGMESLSGKENFILPVDANVMQAVESEAALRATGINIMTLTKELGEVSDAAKIFLVDACRERPQGRGIARTGGGLVAYADEEIPADTLMILAAAPKALASDGEKHGPFTAALLDILPKGGQDLMNAFFAVSDRVQEVTQKQQIPWLKFDGSGAIFRANSFLKASVPGVAPLPMAPPAVVEPKGSKMEFTRADLAIPHRWIDAQGRETEAVFGGIQGSGFDAIVLLRTANGTTGKFPLAKLSPESREKARNLAAIDPGMKSQAEEIHLFNGRDLTGWTVRTGSAEFSVSGDSIVGKNKRQEKGVHTFLTTNAEFENFIFSFEFKADANADINSGVQFRSQFHNVETHFVSKGKTIVRPPDRVYGYQFEIDSRGARNNGAIYDEGRRGEFLDDLGSNPAAQNAFLPGAWNQARIECIGNSIKTFLNGVPAASIQDGMTPKGVIALQVHASNLPGAEIRWRNIKIQPLDSKTLPSP